MIVFDNSADIGNANPNTSLTVSYTVGSGANRILFVHVLDTTNVGITSVTYNAVGMTDIGTTVAVPTTSQTLHTFYLVNPASGAHNVVVTMVGSTGFGVLAESYSGALQVSPLDVTGVATANTNNAIAKALTTTVVNDWAIAVTAFSSGTQSAGTSTTLRNTESLFSMAQFDGNADLPIGSFQLNVNNTVNTQAAMLMTTFKPAPPTTSGGAFLLNFV